MAANTQYNFKLSAFMKTDNTIKNLLKSNHYRIMMTVSLIISLILLSNCSLLKAQSGELDSTFAFNGKLYINMGPNINSTDRAYSLAIQTDEKILIAGSTWTGHANSFALARCNSDGTLDNTFNQCGIVTTAVGISSVIESIAIQPDNKIIAVGSSHLNHNDGFLLARYHPDGSLDSSFGINGIVRTQISGVEEGARSVKIQSDGKIIIGGYSRMNDLQNFALARYQSNGMIDTTFGVNGIQITAFNDEADGITSIALQSDQKIVAGGYSYHDGISNFALARYNPDGSPDTTFGSEGKIVSLFNNRRSIAWSTVIQKNGKILLGGTYGEIISSDILLARYNADGSPDSTFNHNGYTIVDIDSCDYIYSIAIRPDDRIIIAGQSYDFVNNYYVLAQFDANGIVDSLFAVNGISITPMSTGSDTFGDMCLQNDGKILVAGSEYVDTLANSDFVLLRFYSDNNNGVSESTVECYSPIIYPNPVMSEFQVSYVLRENLSLSLQLYDIQGHLCQTFFSSQVKEAGHYKDKFQLNPCLPDAIYFLELSSYKGKVALKIVKE